MLFNKDVPTDIPSNSPSNLPSSTPSIEPSRLKSAEPSLLPSSEPSLVYSEQPSLAPSNQPSDEPSKLPSTKPSILESDFPSSLPSTLPSTIHSSVPSKEPSLQPTNLPTLLPSLQPSLISSTSTNNPSIQPTLSLMPTLSQNQTSTVIISTSATEETQDIKDVEKGICTAVAETFASQVSNCTVIKANDSTPSKNRLLGRVLQSDLQLILSFDIALNTADVSEVLTSPTFQNTVENETGLKIEVFDITESPSLSPASLPSLSPTVHPSHIPSKRFSELPSTFPSLNPTTLPSTLPTVHPSLVPSKSPTEKPSSFPSVGPTASMIPSMFPTSYKALFEGGACRADLECVDGTCDKDYGCKSGVSIRV